MVKVEALFQFLNLRGERFRIAGIAVKHLDSNRAAIRGTEQAVADLQLPSRPGESHPEPLTDPDLTLSRHPARATERRLPPSAGDWSSSCFQLARSQRR